MKYPEAFSRIETRKEAVEASNGEQKSKTRYEMAGIRVIQHKILLPKAAQTALSHSLSF